MPLKKIHGWMRSAPLGQLVSLAVAVRLILLLYGALQDHYLRVKYTDVDYAVITDGAQAMVAGGSPFERATYRYTPLLGLLMMPNVLWWHHAGKLLFCACDVAAGYLVFRVLADRAAATGDSEAIAQAKTLTSYCIWLNPIVVNVSTRGNADMLITFMCLLVLALFNGRHYVSAAAIVGFAVHFKLYPVIYAAPLVFALWHNECCDDAPAKPTSRREASSSLAARPRRKSLLQLAPVVFMCAVAAIAAFAIPTAACGRWFGQRYYDESLLYHFGRVDHRHNLSPYWFLMYLNMSPRSAVVGGAAALGDYSSTLVAFIPQVFAMLYVAFRLRRSAAHAFCASTMLFVAFNKVCTVQYFVWFIPMLPFVLSAVALAPSVGRRLPIKAATVAVSLFWLASLVEWMLVAKSLEFDGENVFVALWASSCVFFVAQVGAAAWFSRVALEAQLALASNRVKQP